MKRERSTREAREKLEKSAYTELDKNSIQSREEAVKVVILSQRKTSLTVNELSKNSNTAVVQWSIYYICQQSINSQYTLDLPLRQRQYSGDVAVRNKRETGGTML